MVTVLKVGSGGLGSSEGLAGPLSTLLRIVGRPEKIPRRGGVPRVIYVELTFLPGDVEKVPVSSCFENDCDLPILGLQQIEPLSYFTSHTYCKLISFQAVAPPPSTTVTPTKPTEPTKPTTATPGKPTSVCYSHYLNLCCCI